VVTPSVEFAINHTKNKNIGVVGTFSTIYSNAYTKMFQKLGSGCNVKEIACPLFVPIIEEGWANTDIAENIAKTYLNEFQNINIDTLILGCTHYPIMVNTIQKVLSSQINLVYSGKTVGIKLKDYLKKQNYENSSLSSQPVKYFVTDFPQKFDELGSRFLGRQLNNVVHISII
jgi:glutamate racemase